MLATAGPVPARPAPVDWRTAITQGDRARLRDWRTAWVSALAGARAGGAGDRIDTEGVLLQPDSALDGATAPDGDYRCRVIKLGAQHPAGLGYIAYPGFHCRIGGGMLVKLDGSQRPAGRLYPVSDSRAIFLGAITLGDEAGLGRYGRDPDRDAVGVFERVGPQRWRLVLPYPRWESLLDVIELVPANVSDTSAP